jgi:spermidine synthase
MKPWRALERVETPEGVLELRQRGERDFLMMIDGRVLMTSAAHRSEEALARLAAEAAAPGPWRRVMMGGLGMGHTLRALLDGLSPDGTLTAVDLNPQVVAWCRGPLAVLTGGAIDDHRVDVRVADVARVIARAPAGRYDGIVLDLYEGPHHAANRREDPLYGAAALARAGKALRPGGVLAIWSEEPDKPFERRLVAAGFAVKAHRSGRGGRIHTIYVAVRPGPPVNLRRRSKRAARS